MKPKILIVEDERIVAEDIRQTILNIGHDVSAIVSSGEDAVAAVEKMAPDLVLMDIVLKGKMDGIEAAKYIRKSFEIPVVYLTAYSDEKTLKRAKKTEPFGYIMKPYHEQDLKTTIE
ncbi:MAG TPA: response regulator, partial [Bacteroidetes bacterium]|nr:response regulator [Bacteroidota bacterium]